MPVPASILIVDDNALTLLTLTRILQQHGYAVLSASNASNALQLAQTCSLDLVIMDYQLPGSQGEFGPALRKLRPSLPIVVLSGDPAAAEAKQFANLLLAKPQEPDALLHEIGRLLRAKSRQHAA